MKNSIFITENNRFLLSIYTIGENYYYNGGTGGASTLYTPIKREKQLFLENTNIQIS